ncbi:DUF5696 domain-containing protein [Candidatus Izemoplasma sp. B36]|uniref:DUF5696 domain-containing protein n=1 Tax=Candidatus Izemoplasma sp. B36 TaxID=3242468 RepID=UPI003557D25F
MANIFKKVIVLVILSFTIVGTVKALQITSVSSEVDTSSNYQFIEDAKLASSRYSRPEDYEVVDLAYYVEITADDALIASNSNFELYFNEETIDFKVKDLTTNYVWATSVEDADAGTYSSFLQSSIAIDYIQVEKDMLIKENVGLIDIALTTEYELLNDGVKVSLDLGGYCSSRNCVRMYDRYLDGDITLEQLITAGYVEIDAAFDVEVRLTDSGICAKVPVESIVERSSEKVLISSITLFPGLGATEMDNIPGYMVIPDGAGALIRYEDNEGQFQTPLIERFYGSNLGLEEYSTSVVNYPLSMPIFGAVHGVDQNAVIGIVEGGQYNARLHAFPNGARSIPYNLIFTKFDVNQVYRQSYLSDGTGGINKNIRTLQEDISISYNFLNNQDANYVGIANNYRDYLIDNSVLELQNQSGDIDIFLNYLMSDSELSFFGSTLVQMSTVKQVKEMYDYFVEQGIVNQKVALMGWNEGGYSGMLPSKIDYENSLGSNASFRDLIEHINQTNSVMLINNYVAGSEDTSRISYRTDVAKGINRFKLEFERPLAVHEMIYAIYPDVSNELALSDYEDYLDENVEVLFESIASILFTTYDGEVHFREDAYQAYLEIMETYDGIGNYFYPFSYAYKYTDSFFEVPLYNSQLKYYDDLVPLLQIVLKGSIDLYASYLNFNSLGRETLLNIIDFGMNPSFVLTYEPSSELKNTDMGRFFTTEYDLWKETVSEQYNYVNGALKYVNGAYIVAREVIDYGFVKVTYSNGVDIYINYTSSNKTDGAITVPYMDYYVGGAS